jgi:hypothetical protein
MRGNKNLKILSIYSACLLLAGFNILPVVSAQSSSPNYKVEEVYFGVGGELQACSNGPQGGYCAQQSLGSLAAGNTSSAAYDAYAGFLSQNAPFLEMAVMNATVNFGTLDPNSYSSGAAQGGSCSCSFYVRSYVSSSYVVVSASQPPTSENGDSLDGKSTTGTPSNNAGLEEFGINVVNNSTPNIGADPVNIPDNSFADGQAFGDGGGGARDYDDVDQFAYSQGDIIARSAANTPTNPAIGHTDYTISYIAKPSNITPAGQYTMNHILIAVATF